MKTVVNASIGKVNFMLEEDAYGKLSAYLTDFRAKLFEKGSFQADEVMEDLEFRIAELFRAEVGDGNRVVSLSLVDQVVEQLGMPDGSSYREGTEDAASAGRREGRPEWMNRRLYRDTDERMIAGVCSGLAKYFDIDTALVRVIMLILLITGTAGFWIYLILWIIAPKAMTPAQKCEMRGLPVTAENMARFSRTTAKR